MRGWQALISYSYFAVQVGGENLTLCWPARMQRSCCTDLSYGANADEARYGIKDGMVKADPMSDKIMTADSFKGDPLDCSKE